jgi:hypothetical protein
LPFCVFAGASAGLPGAIFFGGRSAAGGSAVRVGSIADWRVAGKTTAVTGSFF